MRSRDRWGRAILALGLLLLGACSAKGAADGRVNVVAAFYPLAWVAQQVGGDAVVVEDLTPAGAEPHDIQLTARQRNDIHNADVVLLFGKGFQPEVERAARDVPARTIDLLDGVSLLPSNQKGLDADPHVWLDLSSMIRIVEKIRDALPSSVAGAAERAGTLVNRLATADHDYAKALGSCRLKTLVATHEAFGYLASRYGLTQIALTGLSPDAEPSAGQLQNVRQLASRREVGAVFYESTSESERIGESVARDAGLSALPLSPIETKPKSGDFLSQVAANLESLKKGLECR